MGNAATPDMEQLCRVCMSSESTLVFVDLFGEPQREELGQGKQLSLAAILNECTDYEVSREDALPQRICSSCVSAACSAFDFKRKCEESYRQLSQLVKKQSLQSEAHAEEVLNVDAQLECPICGAGFAQPLQVQKHINIMHRLMNEEQLSESENSLGTTDEILLEQEQDSAAIEAIHEIPIEPAALEERQSEEIIVNGKIDKIGVKLEPKAEEQVADFIEVLMCEESPGLVLAQQSNAGIDSDAAISRNASSRWTGGGAKPSKRNQGNCCGICKRTFATSSYLARHLHVHQRKRFGCKECNTNYETRDELVAHIKEQGHDKPMLCPECGQRCKTSHTLMVHMRRHTGEKPFKCKFCSKGFPRMDDLRVHEKYHTGEKSHFCKTCGKGFLRKYNLTIHMRVHTGERPYKCPHCPQAFAQANDLKSHIRRHTGERFRCEICQAAFLQHYKIRQHKLQHHGIHEDARTQRVAKFISIEEQEQQIQRNSLA